MENKQQDILSELGYDISFKNVDLEKELYSSLNSFSVEKVISRYSILSGGHKPMERYLDYVVEATDYLYQVSNNQNHSAGISDVLKYLDVSDSLKYLVGEGLDKVVDEIEEEYLAIVDMLEKKAPFLQISKRFPFTNQMKEFCRIYLAHSLKPIATNMINHQSQLKKTIEVYKKQMNDKKDRMPLYVISKIAGFFAGGIIGSLAVSTWFSGMNSERERQFGYELGIAHQTWYQIQNGDLHRTLMGDYSPRLYHLYLSIIGGLLLKVNKDLNFLGLEIDEFYPQRSEISLGLNTEGYNQIMEKLERVLNSKEENEEEIFNFIHNLSKANYLLGLEDETDYLLIEKLYARYMYLQAKSLLTSGTYKDLPLDLPSIKWTSDFSFLYEENYKIYTTTILNAFEKHTSDMANIYEQIMELNELYDYADSHAKTKIMRSNALANMYTLYTRCFLKEHPKYLIGSASKIEILSLIKKIEKSNEAKNDIEQIFKLKSNADSQGENKSFLSRILGKFSSVASLDEVIGELDYKRVEEFVKKNKNVNTLSISSDLVNPKFRSLLKLISSSVKVENVQIESNILEDIINANDCEAMSMLFTLGLDPFKPINNSYLFAEAINSGTTVMVYEFCDYVEKNIDVYKRFLTTMDKAQVSLFYCLLMGGYGKFASHFHKLVSLVPFEQKERELIIGLSSISELNAIRMYTECYPIGHAHNVDREDSFIHHVYGYSKFSFINYLNEENPEILRAVINGKTVLRHVYELGYIEMAEHFHEVLDVHDYGEVYIEDIEEAVYSFNENYLILLKEVITDLKDILKEIRLTAKQNGEWPVVELIDRVVAK